LLDHTLQLIKGSRIRQRVIQCNGSESIAANPALMRQSAMLTHQIRFGSGDTAPMRFNSTIPFVFLLPILTSAFSCQRQLPPVPKTITAPQSTPVVVLPDIDLASAVAEVDAHRSLASLAGRIPAGQFAVRFQARRPSTLERLPRAFMLKVRYRAKNSHLVNLATCHIWLTTDPSLVSGTYEGLCDAPKRKGPAILELRFRGASYFARSCEIQ
jgi:hypothetical protein